MPENADDILRDIRGSVNIAQMKTGAAIMIEALKADRLIPDNIDKVKAASEAIRRHGDPMSTPMLIIDMVED